MKLLSILTVVVVVAFRAALMLASSPEERRATDPKSVFSQGNPLKIQVPLADLYFSRAVLSPAWSPDGKEIAFTTDLAGRLNLWKVSSEGGWPLQLGQSEDLQYNAAWSPDGKWIAYQQDHGGDELFDIYVVPSNGGKPRNLTNTRDIREIDPRWSPDGGLIAVSYKPKTSSMYDLALLDAKTGLERKLTHEVDQDRNWSSIGWSPDGHILYANRLDVNYIDSDIYSIDIITGKAANLSAHSGKVLYLGTCISPDGQSIILTSNARGGYQNIALLTLATGDLRWVTDGHWEAAAGCFSPDGRSFSYTLNEDGRQDVYVVDASSGTSEKVPLPPGVNGFEAGRVDGEGIPAPFANPFSPRGERMFVLHEDSQSPPDLWVYEMASRKVAQLTFSSIATLASANLPASQIVHYKSFDGTIISAFLWLPFNLERDGSHPALVLPHQGPTEQQEDSWDTDIAALVSSGFICIAPNMRGSTGYGLEFKKANYQDLGGGDLRDEAFAAEFLKQTGYVDPNKIGMYGASYGGFMTLMAIGKMPGSWAAAVEEYGIIDWTTILTRSDPFVRQMIKALLGDPKRDHHAYRVASPIHYIRDAHTPLLILHGDNDVWVPKEQAEQVVSILEKQGAIVEAHFFPNEGHGFNKRENQLDAMRRTLAWFGHYLGIPAVVERSKAP